MGWLNINGNWIGRNSGKKAESWSSYWATRLPIEQQNFLNLEYGALICWDITCFANTYPCVDIDVNTFNPTGNIQTGIDDWLDTFVSAGMGYAILTAKHIAGFCLWPTSCHAVGHDPYSIAQTTWYSNNGSPNIVKIFIDGCIARGLKVGIYYSPVDLTYDARQGVDFASLSAPEAEDYRVLMATQIEELMTYGKIDYFWFDTWGYWLPYTEGSGIPYQPIRDFIGSKQKDCLVINNNPGHVPWSEVSEIKEYEAWINTPIVGNTIPSENVLQSMINYQWFYRNTMADLDGNDRRVASYFFTPEQVYTRRQLVNGRNCNLLISATPNETALLNKYEKISYLGSNPNLLIYPYFATVETDDPDKVIITMIKSLAASVPATSAFTLAGKTITNVAVSGLTVTLTVSVPYALGDTIAVSYTKPASNMLKDALNNEVASFSDLSVTNNITATNIEFLLTKMGSGLGVATLSIHAIEDITITLGANAKFYSDAAGTLDESATWDCAYGNPRTIYIRCATGTATFTISKNKIKNFGADYYDGWPYVANAPSISGNISLLTNLEMVRVGGFSNLSGAINLIPKLKYLRVGSANTLSGDISSLKDLFFISVAANNTLEADLGILADGMQHFVLGINASHVDTYTSGGNFSSFLNGSAITIIPPVGYGLTSAEVDQLLIDVAATKTIGRRIVIDLTGSNQPRTSASDAAKAAIEADAGGVVTTN